MSLFRFPSFPQGIFATVQNDGGRQSVIMREMLIVIRSEREGSAAVVRKPVRRHPERQRRICHRGGEAGKKIKAISCELSAIS